MKRLRPGPAGPLWYKDAIIYELRIRSYCDGNGDGIGDFRGLESRLDYIQALGVTAVWLLPFYPSPQRDDGYDISDYTGVHPDCGDLDDVRRFIRAAHARGLAVITELVLNHTSDQHAWFQRARRAPRGSVERNYYVWSDDPHKYPDARIIFSDFETSNWTWDPIAQAYYWHRFYFHQPDLNFDSPAVRKEVLRLVDLWLGLGVDGLRLDAVPYLFEREGTICENLPETHAFLRELRAYIDQRYSNRMLLAEANQWPEDAAAYMDTGRECHMAFHFPIMPRLFMSIRMEDRFPLTDIWAQTPPIDSSCQWALFLRNHDELTLEMVTDEERDYMYQAYAQDARMRINLGIRRRLAPLLGNNRRAIELINGLLFSLPGAPVIYYGDEIGMGDNVFLGDRDGVRTPMQWSADRNAGFSSANPQRLILPVVIDYEYHYQTVNVEAQEANRHSLLWWIRRLIALRRQFKAFSRGAMEFLAPVNPHVLAFIRSFENETILVVANLSRFVQYVELDLARFKGMAPLELFSRAAFPQIGDLPYLLTLGPHGFIWFSLESPHLAAATDASPAGLPELASRGSLSELTHPQNHAIASALAQYLPRCRWYRSKSRTLRAVRIIDTLHLDEALLLAFISAEYASGEAELYLLPLGVAYGAAAAELREKYQPHLIAEVSRGDNGPGVLYDAIVSPGFGRAMLNLLHRDRRVRTANDSIVPSRTSAFSTMPPADRAGEPHFLRAEQSNSSIVFDNTLLLKLFRKPEPGLNPDIELTAFLTEHSDFTHIPALGGWLDYQQNEGAARTLLSLQSFVPNQGDAWQFTLTELSRFFESAATQTAPPLFPEASPLALARQDAALEPAVAEMLGLYLQSARLMGERIAQLHHALAAASDIPAFVPEPFTTIHQRSRYQSMRNLSGHNLRTLTARLPNLNAEDRVAAQLLLSKRNQLDTVFERFLKCKLACTRMRIHGDLHLGQLLYTGRDFVLIDFEGEPARPLEERRRKRSPLQDVAGMLRSFDYAAITAMREREKHGLVGKASSATLEPWARLWRLHASAAFLRGYFSAAAAANFLPPDADALAVMLNAFVLEKAIYEVGYELDNRPDWVSIPIGAILRLLERDAASPA